MFSQNKVHTFWRDSQSFYQFSSYHVPSLRFLPRPPSPHAHLCSDCWPFLNPALHARSFVALLMRVFYLGVLCSPPREYVKCSFKAQLKSLLFWEAFLTSPGGIDSYLSVWVAVSPCCPQGPYHSLLKRRMVGLPASALLHLTPQNSEGGYSFLPSEGLTLTPLGSSGWLNVWTDVRGDNEKNLPVGK